MKAGKIHEVNFTTAQGNTLHVFYNDAQDLFVVDIVSKNERDGNEIVRMRLDEKALLKHVR